MFDHRPECGVVSLANDTFLSLHPDVNGCATSVAQE